jgi:uncharacterized membrane protein
MNGVPYLLSLSFIFTVPAGITLVCVGVFLLIKPPKKINGWYGYRTGSSMKSKEKWDFAQSYSSKLTILIGLLLVLIGFGIPFIQLDNKIISAIGVPFLFIGVFVLFILTEMAIDRRFK